MQQQVVPMIHVPDVRATIDWYNSLGFKVRDQGKEDGGQIVWAALTYGNSEVMLSAGGKPYRRPPGDRFVHFRRGSRQSVGKPQGPS